MRSALLIPDYLEGSAWHELLQVADQVALESYDTAVSQLRQLRSSCSLEDPNAVTPHLDRASLILSLRTKGMNFSKVDKLTDEQLYRMNSTIGYFWRSKGTYSVQDFLSVVLNTEVRITRYWTDYSSYELEGSPSIGTPVYSGGSWYPTTFIQLVYDTSILSQITASDLVDLLYEVGNYSLVVRMAISNTNIEMRTLVDEQESKYPKFLGTSIVALGHVTYIEQTIPVVEI